MTRQAFASFFTHLFPLHTKSISPEHLSAYDNACWSTIELAATASECSKYWATAILSETDILKRLDLILRGNMIVSSCCLLRSLLKLEEFSGACERHIGVKKMMLTLQVARARAARLPNSDVLVYNLTDVERILRTTESRPV